MYQILHSISECYSKNIDAMIKEIDNNFYRGTWTYLRDFSLDETKIVHKDVVIDGNVTKDMQKI